MRIGVCSDIHGYADRLGAVIAEMRAVEKWCLGDLIGGGPDPVRVIELARQLAFVCSETTTPTCWRAAGGHKLPGRSAAGMHFGWLP